MRKYLILTSLLALTGCMLGDGGSASGLLLLFGNDTSSKPAFAGTPEETRKANESVTKMETVIDNTARAIEIYEASGLDIADNEAYENGIYLVEGYIESEQYRNMSDEDKLKLAKTVTGLCYVRKLDMFLRGFDDTLAINDLENALKMLNAFYKVESNGRIEEKFNIKEFVGEFTSMPAVERKNWLAAQFENEDFDYWTLWDIVELYEYHTDDMIWGSPYQLWGNGFDWIKLDENGKIVSVNTMGANFIRDGDTNVFKNVDDETETITLETFGDGKLTYSDFGYLTYEHGSKNHIDVFTMHSLDDKRSVLVKDAVLKADYSLDFKGTAVGLFVNNPDGYEDELAYTTKMRTDNATLHIERNNDVFSSQLSMPFSEDGWYDVKFVEDSMSGTQTIFSNYKGDGSNRIPLMHDSNGVVETDTGGWKASFISEYALEAATEVAGAVDVDFGLSGVRFEAAYGVTRQ